ncbi:MULTISPECIES: hypothetical protein [unclassified Streptomyces]|uniref:hypothetical protein n=1 Tax=unclassified Streptomyces TaxID=2593676 RepID=UPI003416C4C8
MSQPVRGGYPVLADHLRDVLYVMVPAGSAAGIELPADVRVLSAGHQLLVPYETHASPVARWLSPPRAAS